jgi:hypothetical protein
MALNNINRILTGCLKLALIAEIQILSGIVLPSPNIRREVAAMIKKKNQISDHRHLMFGEIQITSRLKSKKLFWKTSEPITELPTVTRLKIC